MNTLFANRKNCMNRKQLCCSGYRGCLRSRSMSYCFCFSQTLFCTGWFLSTSCLSLPLTKRESEFFALTNLSKFITTEPMKLQPLGQYFKKEWERSFITVGNIQSQIRFNVACLHNTEISQVMLIREKFGFSEQLLVTLSWITIQISLSQDKSKVFKH